MHGSVDLCPKEPSDDSKRPSSGTHETSRAKIFGPAFIRRSPIKQKVSDSLRRHSTDNKQAQSAAACACMLLHCCAALMHRADACAALQLLLLPVCCGACSRRPPCIIRVARRRLATQMCLCRGCCQTWRWHLARADAARGVYSRQGECSFTFTPRHSHSHPISRTTGRSSGGSEIARD